MVCADLVSDVYVGAGYDLPQKMREWNAERGGGYNDKCISRDVNAIANFLKEKRKYSEHMDDYQIGDIL